MKLTELLTPQCVLPTMEASTPWAALEELIDHLIATGRVSQDAREGFLESLKDREEQASTGIGYGVAIPHAHCDRLEKVEAVLGRSEEGIDFEAPDNAPVRFVILLLVPRSQANLHLQTLASVANVFSRCEVRENLKDAENAEALHSVLLAAETSAV